MSLQTGVRYYVNDNIKLFKSTQKTNPTYLLNSIVRHFHDFMGWLQIPTHSRESARLILDSYLKDSVSADIDEGFKMYIRELLRTINRDDWLVYFDYNSLNFDEYIKYIAENAPVPPRKSSEMMVAALYDWISKGRIVNILDETDIQYFL